MPNKLYITKMVFQILWYHEKAHCKYRNWAFSSPKSYIYPLWIHKWGFCDYTPLNYEFNSSLSVDLDLSNPGTLTNLSLDLKSWRLDPGPWRIHQDNVTLEVFQQSIWTEPPNIWSQDWQDRSFTVIVVLSTSQYAQTTVFSSIVGDPSKLFRGLRYYYY